MDRDDRVATAYGARAGEYVERLGSTADVHPADLLLIRTWAASCDGPLLDAGCGPGHLTADLHERGHRIAGLDLTPAFVEHARRRHPDVEYEQGSLERLPRDDAALGGVLAWYSLIHLPPDRIGTALSEVRRVIAPGGLLLLAGFTGDALEPFPHAVTEAWSWPPGTVIARLEDAGFLVEEWQTRRVAAPRPRPHAAYLARAV